MKKNIVLYYSKSGNNKFLAKKIHESLDSDIEEIKPNINTRLLIMIGSSLGNKKLKHNVRDYERIILCGPIWMGKLLSPLKNFIVKQKENINKLVFVTCCGSSYEQKNKKYGHGPVFTKVKNILKDKCIHCEAFPVSLILPKEKEQDTESVMQARINENNFKEGILSKFNSLIEKLKEG